MMTRTDADDTDQLARDLLAVGAAMPADAASVATVRRQLNGVRLVVRSDAEHAPSEAALHRAVAIFRPAPSRGAEPIVARLLARLTFDSRVARPSFGFRGGSSPTMLRYEVDDLLVDLEVRRPDPSEPDRLALMGQIDGAPDDTIRVELRAPDGTVVAEGVQDRLGSFTLSVPPSTYDLVAHFGSTELTVPAIRLG